MKDKANFVKSKRENANFFSNSNYFASSSDLPCKKHPLNSSPVGICSHCLTEKLIELVCSDCGEQRISSCSCSDISSYRNSSCNLDVGSVGRLSFLMENEKGINNDEHKTLFTEMKMKQSGTEDIVLLTRSNSCVVEVKKSNGFWKIGKLFKKKKREKEGFSEINRDEFDKKFEVSAMNVSRSRSISSFIDADFHHDAGSIACSSAKISDFDGFESRKSGFKGGMIEFQNGFAMKEYDFSKLNDGDDDEFIDLKIDLSNKSKTESSVLKKYDQREGGGDIGPSSRRVMINERGIKKMKNTHMKSWK